MFIFFPAQMTAHNPSYVVTGGDKNLGMEVLQAIPFILAMLDHDLHAGWTILMGPRVTASNL